MSSKPDPTDALAETAKDLINSAGDRITSTETCDGKGWTTICVNPHAVEALKTVLAAYDAAKDVREAESEYG